MVFQKAIISFLISIVLSSVLSAQNIDLTKMSEDQIFYYMDNSLDSLIGEACGVGGEASKPYVWTTACIKDSKINLIRRLIYSKNPAVQFFASTLCEELEKEGMISLSTIEKESINQIKKSKAKVRTCSGCTYFSSFPLSSMYDCKSGACVITLEEYPMWAHREVKEYEDRKRMDEKTFLYLQDSTGNAIGFGCGLGWVRTATVALMTTVMQESKIRIIRNLLYSSNPAVQFLSVDLCESLAEEKLIILTKEEKKEITEIKRSKSITSICSGCTFNREISLNDLLNSEDKEISKFRISIKSWADKEVRSYRKTLKKSR